MYIRDLPGYDITVQQYYIPASSSTYYCQKDAFFLPNAYLFHISNSLSNMNAQARRKGIKIGTKVQQTKDVIYETYYDLQDEFDCEKGYEDSVKCDEDNCNGDYDGKNDDNISPCKDVASYKDVASCKNDSTSCRNIPMKSPLWPRQKQANKKIPKRKSNSDNNGENDDNYAPCKDVTSYKDVAFCRIDSTSCRNIPMKSPMWPRQKLDGVLTRS